MVGKLVVMEEVQLVVVTTVLGEGQQEQLEEEIEAEVLKL